MDDPNLDLIAQRLLAGEASDEIIAEVLHLRNVTPQLESVMLMTLSDTRNTKLRNALALALATVKSKAAGGRIMELLTDRRTDGSRATLIYSLNKLDYMVDPLTLSAIIAIDSMEAAEEAFLMLQKSIEGFDYPPLFIHASIHLLAHLLPQVADKDRADIMMDALSILRAIPTDASPLQGDGAEHLTVSA